MNYENPTWLRIGMHGEFRGIDFRLIGRVVMGVRIDGETYYWNEFNLQARDGTAATLVFEGDGDGGGEWRLFSLFEPEYPMTAMDAATKNVGDALNLDGTDVRVTLVQSSHVYYVEGEAPAGAAIGSTANYFNAEAGDIMQVVSWTGDEVEYYNGSTLPPAAVEHAFKVSPVVRPKAFGGFSGNTYLNPTNDNSTLKSMLQVGLVLIFFIFLFCIATDSFSRTHESGPVRRIPAGPPPLPVGASGVWQDKKLSITTHFVMEIDRVDAIYGRNEYLLSDDLGKQFLLVCDNAPGFKSWTLFHQIDPLIPPTLPEAAGQKVGEVVNVNGVVATVTDLFESTVQTVEKIGFSNWHTGDATYNYLARSQYETVLVRWNKSRLTCYEGKTVPARAFADAFTSTNKP
jgi:hypothetical protein